MLQMSQVYVHWWKTFVKCWLSTVAVHLLHYNYVSDERNLYSLEESNRISQNVEQFKEYWCRIRRARVDLDSILRPCSYNILWNGPSPKRALQMDAGKSAISFLDIRSVQSFQHSKKKLRMVNWSTLAATLGVCYCAVRPLCHLLRLITEMAPTSFCFLLWTLGPISWISLWTIACVTDSAIRQKIGSS